MKEIGGKGLFVGAELPLSARNRVRQAGKCEKVVNLGKLGLTRSNKVGKMEHSEWSKTGVCPERQKPVLYGFVALLNRIMFDALSLSYNRDGCFWNLGVF